MSEQPYLKKQQTGAPPWVMTFADLMSLLLCFFVLLLSFSEMDVSKYKEMAGSMKNAFGVQRDIQVKEPPKGISVIAREFSPARADPTPLNVIRQMTTSDHDINLHMGKSRKPPVRTPRDEVDPESAESERREQQSENPSEAEQQELAKAKQLAAVRLDQMLADEKELASKQDYQHPTIDNPSLEDLVKAKLAADRLKKLEESARLINAALSEEIEAGSVDVETVGQKIIIRVREKASFGSGRAELKDDFIPLLHRVAAILKDSDGKIVVAGHTDPVPIYTERYRSNWELSAARAVSVAHAMMETADIPSGRFLVQGFADTDPMADNGTATGRATNRRVEIILQQGDDKTSDNDITGSEEPVTNVSVGEQSMPMPVADPPFVSETYGMQESLMVEPAEVGTSKAESPGDAAGPPAVQSRKPAGAASSVRVGSGQ